MRGGLCHTLAGPADTGQRNRRVLLALSWLSVEDARGAPMKEGLRVARGDEEAHRRGEAVKTALRDILSKRGVEQGEIADWLRDCSSSLEARIRDDCVWVNRSACFDRFINALQTSGGSLTRDEAWDFIEPFLGSKAAYLANPYLTDSQEDSETGVRSDNRREEAKDLVRKAGQWLSSRFGTGEGANFSSMASAYGAIATWASHASHGRSGEQTLQSFLGNLTPAQ